MHLSERFELLMRRKKSLDHDREQFLSDLAREVSDLKLQMEDLIRLTHRLEGTLRKQEGTLRVLCEQRTQERTDVSDEVYFIHHEIAHSFRDLVFQMLTQITSDALERRRAERCSPGESEDVPRAEAEVIHHLTRTLFGDQVADQGRMALNAAMNALQQDGISLKENELDALWDKAQNIIRTVKSTQHAHEWRFGYTRGMRVNSGMQEVWALCSPEDPVEFVVAPAYVVTEGNAPRVYVRQLVYTSPDRISAAVDEGTT